MTPTEQDRRIAEEAVRKILPNPLDALDPRDAIPIILAAIVEAKKPLEEDRARLDWLENEGQSNGCLSEIESPACFGGQGWAVWLEINGRDPEHGGLKPTIRAAIAAARAKCPTNQTEAPVASDKTDGEDKP